MQKILSDLSPKKQPLRALKQRSLPYLFLSLLNLLITPKISAQSAATVTIDCAIDKGTLFRAEAYNNVAGVNTGAATRDADYAYMSNNGIRAKILRIWVPETIYNPSTGNYNFGNYDDYLSDVSAYFADEILVCIEGNVMVETWNYTPAQCKPVLKNIISYLKSKYPKVTYIEGLNEPDNYKGQTMTPAKVYPYYKAFYEAVNEVNAELQPAVPLKVGGPALMSFKYSGEEWLGKFLDDYKSDPAANKKLDFLSFHTYSYKTAPREVNSIAAEVKSWFVSRGLPDNIPSFVSETGVFPGGDVSGSLEQDVLIQAAGMAAYTYWFTNTSNTLLPFNWVLRHAENERKDQIVTRPAYYSDRLTPYGNLMKMMGMMKTQRVGDHSTVMDNDGIGVYGLASKDNTGISILTWNYQHTGKKDYFTTVDIKNMPAIFDGKAVRRKIYRIDGATSNHLYNINNCNLQLVSDTTISNPGASAAVPIGILTENSIQMIVLEPVNTPVSTPVTDKFSLKATKLDHSTVLSWSTNAEENTLKFEIYHSTDGTAFSYLGEVNAAGNSSVKKTYDYIHKHPVSGLNYYQVKLLDGANGVHPSGISTAFFNLVDREVPVLYNFGSSPNFTGAASSGLSTGWQATPLTVNGTASGNFFSATSPSNTYAGFSANGNVTMAATRGSLTGRTVTYGNPAVTTVIPATDISALSSFEVTIIPPADELVKINGITFGSRSIGSSGGPASVIIRSSLDNFQSNLFIQNINAASAWNLITANFSMPLTGPEGQPLTIRIYANDAVGGTANNWRIDDLSILTALSPLIPRLHGFDVQAEGAKSLLSWKVNPGTAISQFEVLRSGDGEVFAKIAELEANGNQAEIAGYTFTDESPLAGINYYQIKLTASGNEEIYSEKYGLYIAEGLRADIYYDFGATGSESGNPSSGVPQNWIVSPVSIGNSSRTNDFFTSISATATYSGNSKQGNATLIANAGSLAGGTLPQTSISALSYFEVTLTPGTRQKVRIDNISFGSRSIGTSGGPGNIVIRTSLDNYASNVFAKDINANSAWSLVNAAFATPITGASGQAVTLRIYANDAAGSTSSNNWRIDDLRISVLNTENTEGTMPVEISSFTAKAITGGVLVHWITESEINSSHFEIERSADGTNFIKIIQLNSASSPGDYRYLDEHPMPGLSYYRLKQVDKDGQFGLYGPLAVRNIIPSNDLSLYCENDILHIGIHVEKPMQMTFEVFDLNGRKLIARDYSLVNGANAVQLPAVFPSGLYVVRCSRNGFAVVKKFIKR